jgi:hypothetical protein
VGDKIKGVAVIMIGTIPIIIGSDPKTVMILMLLDLFMMIIWVLTTKRSLENKTHRISLLDPDETKLLLEWINEQRKTTLPARSRQVGTSFNVESGFRPEITAGW